MTTRRQFLSGMSGILATCTAPAIITTPGLLMPVRKIILGNSIIGPRALYEFEFDVTPNCRIVAINPQQQYLADHLNTILRSGGRIK